jgi:hypothetical protein
VNLQRPDHATGWTSGEFAIAHHRLSAYKHVPDSETEIHSVERSVTLA